MKNFKVVDYRIYDTNGKDVTYKVDFFAPQKLTRALARNFKNLLNIIEKTNAPHRIAEVRITK